MPNGPTGRRRWTTTKRKGSWWIPRHFPDPSLAGWLRWRRVSPCSKTATSCLGNAHRRAAVWGGQRAVLVAEAVLGVLVVVAMPVAVGGAVAVVVAVGIVSVAMAVSGVMAVSVVTVAAVVPVVVSRCSWCLVHWTTYQGHL